MYLIREKRNTRSIGCSAWPRTSTERMCLYTHASRTPNSEKKVFFGKTNYTQRNDFKYILFSSCVLLFLVTFRVWKKTNLYLFSLRKKSQPTEKNIIVMIYKCTKRSKLERRKTTTRFALEEEKIESKRRTHTNMIFVTTQFGPRACKVFCSFSILAITSKGIRLCWWMGFLVTARTEHRKTNTLLLLPYDFWRREE